MKNICSKSNSLWALAVAALLAAGPAFADKPSGAGNGKGNQGHQGDQGKGSHGNKNDDHRESVREREYFDDRRRTVAHDYYREQYRGGRCPPGLAKKNNGCMPPGQAKKWRVGHPLPREVIYYEVPQTLVIQIGQPPRGYRYVRVASDLLLIAIGTGMIVDAIQDLGRL